MADSSEDEADGADEAVLIDDQHSDVSLSASEESMRCSQLLQDSSDEEEVLSAEEQLSDEDADDEDADDEDAAADDNSSTLSLSASVDGSEPFKVHGVEWFKVGSAKVRQDARTGARHLPKFTVPQENCNNVLTIFMTLIPPAWIELILTHTNPYLAGKNVKTKKLTPGEVWQFFGYVLANYSSLLCLAHSPCLYCSCAGT